MPGGAGRSGQAVRHQEGDAVGRDASAIGSENVGHKLLSRMGYVLRLFLTFHFADGVRFPVGVKETA